MKRLALLMIILAAIHGASVGTAKHVVEPACVKVASGKIVCLQPAKCTTDTDCFEKFGE